MSADPSQVIGQELEAGESLLWSGQPRKGIVFRGSDVFMIPFSLIWGGFAITVLVSMFSRAGASGLGFIGFLVAIPFLLVALYIVFGRFIVDAIQRDHTCYGVTNHRVIIVSGLVDRQPAPDVAMVTALVALFSPRMVKSLDLRTMSDISVTERLGGSGTITFGPPNPYQYLSGTWWPGTHVFTPSFDLIEQVKSVYRVIRDAQQKRWPA
jgi:hypothetical protein